MKYFLPWTKAASSYNEYACFTYGIERKVVASVLSSQIESVSGKYYYYIYNVGFSPKDIKYFVSVEETKSACNAKLKELGYEFVSEERAEKLRLLL